MTRFTIRLATLLLSVLLPWFQVANGQAFLAEFPIPNGIVYAVDRFTGGLYVLELDF